MLTPLSTYTLKVSDIYPNGYTIPEGYEGEFKIVNLHDVYILAPLGSSTSRCMDIQQRFCRIVLTPIKCKVVKFVETGEYRYATKNEWYLFNDRFYLHNTPETLLKYNIYTRTESYE